MIVQTIPAIISKEELRAINSDVQLKKEKHFTSVNFSSHWYLIERSGDFFGAKFFVHLEVLQPLDGVQREEDVADVGLGNDARLRGQNRGRVP